MAYIAMAYIDIQVVADKYSYDLYTYGLYSHDLYSDGLHPMAVPVRRAMYVRRRQVPRRGERCWPRFWHAGSPRQTRRLRGGMRRPAWSRRRRRPLTIDACAYMHAHMCACARVRVSVRASVCLGFWLRVCVSSQGLYGSVPERNFVSAHACTRARAAHTLLCICVRMYGSWADVARRRSWLRRSLCRLPCRRSRQSPHLFDSMP